jgi:Na+-translocating ferredoxin:NAD+ oxidoreductase RnfC subunit
MIQENLREHLRCGVVAVRESQVSGMEALRSAVRRLRGAEVFGVGDSYPAGDEHLLVYDIVGKRIPQGGIPIDVGVAVPNVNTLANVSRARGGEPVTSRVGSVCGDVEAGGVFEVPVGTSVADVLRLAGNRPPEGKGVLLSGVMMGEVCEDTSRPIDKRTGAVVVLPRENEVWVRKTLPLETIIRRAASVCCQCTFCTEMCPRHLLGHAIAPHKIMRAVGWSRVFSPDIAGALYCSGCGLCGVFVCPMLLSPDRISFLVRAEMARRGVRVEAADACTVEQVRPGRLVPHQRILERTGVAAYDKKLSYRGRMEPERVAIPLAQHAGQAARLRVKPGDRVRRGDLIGSVEDDEVGANVHASIDGVVTGVNGLVVVERR